MRVQDLFEKYRNNGPAPMPQPTTKPGQPSTLPNRPGTRPSTPAPRPIRHPNPFRRPTVVPGPGEKEAPKMRRAGRIQPAHESAAQRTVRKMLES